MVFRPLAKGGAQPRFRSLRRLPGPAPAVSFEADFGSTGKRPNTLLVTLRLAERGGDLSVEADMADRDAEIKPFAFLDPLVTETDRAALVVADYSNGHLYPANTKTPVHSYFNASRLDMPWVGVCDLERGTGYMVLVETSDDGHVICRSQAAGGAIRRRFDSPWAEWQRADYEQWGIGTSREAAGELVFHDASSAPGTGRSSDSAPRRPKSPPRRRLNTLCGTSPQL